MKKFLICLGHLALGLVLATGMFGTAQAATIVSENFEVTVSDLCTGQGKTDLQSRGWGVQTSSNQYCSSHIVSLTNHAGVTTKALRFQYQGNAVNLAEDHNALISRFFSAKTELWERYWYRTEPIPPATQSTYFYVTTKQHYWKNTTGLLAAPVSLMLFGSRELAWTTQGFQDCGYQACNDDPNRATVALMDAHLHPQNNGWYCIETHSKLNTGTSSNGLLEIWIDGTLTTSYTHKMQDNIPSTQGWTELQFFRQNANNMYRYEDDYVLNDGASGRVGCGAAPPPPGDITPPPVPVSPQITSVGNPPVTVAWSPVTNPGDLSGYTVYRKLEACNGSASTTEHAPLGNVTSFSDTTVPTDSPYVSYQVASRDSTGNLSAKSACVNATFEPNVTTVSVVLDPNGGDLTFTGLAQKIRYWNELHLHGSDVEVAGLGGVASYRLSKVWEATIFWVCVEAQGSDGVWETTRDPSSYRCNSVTPGPPEAPAPPVPTGLNLRRR